MNTSTRNDGRVTRVFNNLPISTVQKWKGYHWFVVGTVCIGAFMAALDASIINIALPVLGRNFNVRMQMIEWVSLVYLLTLAALIVPFGRIADMLGRRWMYAFGFVIFMIGSCMCALAPSLSFLLASRVIQAVGAAMLQANSVSIITATTPATSLGKAIGFQASAQGIGLSLGPAIGGALLSWLTWRWIFFVNIPVGLVGTILGILLLPSDKKSAKKERFDFLGAVSLAPSIVALVFCLNMVSKDGWGSPVILFGDTVFVVGIAAFLWIERRSRTPMVDLALFRNRTFALGNVTGILSFAAMYAVLLLVPFYLSDVKHLSSFQAGLYLTIVPIGMTLLTPMSGIVTDKLGIRVPTVTGMLAGGVGCICLALLGEQLWIAPLVTGLFLVGAGLGIFTPPNNSSVMGSAPNHRLGVAGGILNMSRTLGMGIGITLGGLCYQSFLSAYGITNETGAPVRDMVHAFHWSFLLIAGVSFITMILSTIRQAKQAVSETRKTYSAGQ